MMWCVFFLDMVVMVVIGATRIASAMQGSRDGEREWEVVWAAQSWWQRFA